MGLSDTDRIAKAVGAFVFANKKSAQSTLRSCPKEVRFVNFVTMTSRFLNFIAMAVFPMELKNTGQDANCVYSLN